MLQVFCVDLISPPILPTKAFRCSPPSSAITDSCPASFATRRPPRVFQRGGGARPARRELIVVFHAEVRHQLYVFGVFTSFTISQAGMIRHWLRSRAPGWPLDRHQRWGVYGRGALVVTIVKFTRRLDRAWRLLVALMLSSDTWAVAPSFLMQTASPPDRLGGTQTPPGAGYAEGSSGASVHPRRRGGHRRDLRWRAMHPQRRSPSSKARRVSRRLVDRHSSARRPPRRTGHRRDVRPVHCRNLGSAPPPPQPHHQVPSVQSRVVVTDLTHFNRRRRSSLTRCRCGWNRGAISDLARRCGGAVVRPFAGSAMAAVHVDVGRQREQVLRLGVGGDGRPLSAPSPYRGPDPLVDLRGGAGGFTGTLINVVIPSSSSGTSPGSCKPNRPGVRGARQEPGIAITSVRSTWPTSAG